MTIKLNLILILVAVIVVILSMVFSFCSECDIPSNNIRCHQAISESCARGISSGDTPITITYSSSDCIEKLGFKTHYSLDECELEISRK